MSGSISSPSSPTRPMINNVLDTISRYGLLKEGDKVLAAVSGGPDSTCLLHVLHALSSRLRIEISAVHVNHLLRGEESDADEAFVREFCLSMGIRLFPERRDVSRYASDARISVEEAGREIRYRIFDEIADEHGLNKIAVAHNRDDQAETVIMHIIRGTGLDGLAGMPYKRGRVIRPLLDVRRGEIDEYCRNNAIGTRIDSSNMKRDYMRNRVRLDLIPYIDRLFGVDISDRISSMSLLLNEDRKFIMDVASIFYDKIADESGGKVSIDITGLTKCHPSIRRHILRIALEKAAGSLKGIFSNHIEAVLALALKGRTGTSVNLPGGIRPYVSYGEIVIGKIDSEKDLFDKEVEIPGMTYMDEFGIWLDAAVIDLMQSDEACMKLSDLSPLQYLDYDSIAGYGRPDDVLRVRSRMQGDYFTPVGSKYSKKLKKYFIDGKFPRFERDKFLLIAKGNEIAWIIGHKISDKFKVTENTKKVLKLEIIKKEE